MSKFPDNIEDFCLAAVAVGSRITCNPPPTDTDQDVLCLVEADDLDDFENHLSDMGWMFEGEDYAGTKKGDFMSWRKEHDRIEYNLIVTTQEKWFDSFMDATLSCKEKNLLTKKERIAEFDKFMPKEAKVVVHWGGPLPPKMYGAIQQMEMGLAQQQAQQAVWNNPQAAPGGAQGNTIAFGALEKAWTDFNWPTIGPKAVEW